MKLKTERLEIKRGLVPGTNSQPLMLYIVRLHNTLSPLLLLFNGTLDRLSLDNPSTNLG